MPSARSAKRPLCQAPWALTGLGLALLVLLVLPSAQIKIGASQLHGLIGSYTGGGPHSWQLSYSSQGATTWNTRGANGSVVPHNLPWSSTESNFATPDGTSALDAKCIGTVTPTFTWVPANGQDNTTDPPPTQVIVTENGSAKFNGGGANSDHGTLSDGWNADTPPDSPNNIYGPNYGYNASGTHYEVKDGTSGTITLGPFSLNASTPANADPLTTTNGATVSVGLNLNPANSVVMQLNGPIKDASGHYSILVGQGCGASVPALSSSNTTFVWTVSGITFQDWQPTSPENPDASYFERGSGTLTNSTAHWFWNDPNTTSETVTCTATVTPTDGKTAPFKVSVTQKVKVYVPSYDAHGIGGYMQVNSTYKGDPNPELRAGPTAAMTANNQPGGMYWEASVFTPTPPAFGTGRLALVQIAKPHSSYTNLTPPVQDHPNPNNGMTGLDGTFPYGDVVPEAQQLLKDDDNPDIKLVGLGPMGGVVAGSATFSSSYVTYLMYRPPGSDDNTRWVALAQLSWSTNGSATIPDPNNPNSWSSFVTQNDPPDKAGTVNPNTWTSFTGVMGPAFVLSWTSIVRPPRPY